MAKWQKRGPVVDLSTGPTVSKSTVSMIEEEAIVVAFMKHTLLPLDGCLYTLQRTVPDPTRSSSITAYSAPAFQGCRMLKASRLRRRSLRLTQFDICYPLPGSGLLANYEKEISRKSKLRKTSFISLVPLIAYRNLRSFKCTWGDKDDCRLHSCPISSRLLLTVRRRQACL